jgi:CMP-N-acetylneuraminic acid synthetase
MTVYAFIFARGGSQGLPHKNIKLLGGIPLIAHSIKMAQQVDAVKKVYVSTDSDEIAAVAASYSAEIIKRPPELATSTAPEWLAWQHAIAFLKAKGEFFDVFLSLPATSPLRIKVDVEECLKRLTDDTDVVITVTPSSRSPYFNMVIREESGECRLVNDGSVYNRRQDVPCTYDITTVAYALRPSYILEKNSLLSGRVNSVVVPKHRAVDIDDAFDFMVAETLFAHQNKSC